MREEGRDLDTNKDKWTSLHLPNGTLERDRKKRKNGSGKAQTTGDASALRTELDVKGG